MGYEELCGEDNWREFSNPKNEYNMKHKVRGERMEVYKDNSKEMMDFLRRETYKLSPNKHQSFEYGYDFELKN